MERIERALDRAISETGSPGAVLYVGDADTTHVHYASGLRRRVGESLPAERDTIYDLASLTKVVATTTALMMLRDEGELRLDQSIADFVPIPAFRNIKLIHLLTHTSGLIAVSPYYRETSTFEEMFHRYALEGILSAPGAQYRYSDPGFMLLGRTVEIIVQDSLDAFCAERIFTPLAMTKTRYRPPATGRDEIAPTELCDWRGRIVHGEVHDENCFAIGGIAGHAGLFSTAQDLALFCRAMLAGKLLKESTLREITTMDKVPIYPWQGIGWQLDPWPSKAQGFLPGRHVFGHTGWTGTCLWLDRDTGLFAILLSNTCHPSRSRRDNAGFRRIVHSAIADAFYPRSTNTHTGLDRVCREEFDVVQGKRIALLTNHAAVDQYGRPIRDVLALSGGTQLKRLYSPEHGIEGQAEAGESVKGQRAAVPIVSLYGEQKAPAESELRDIDLFVVDLQDVGSRYYTYPATLKRCMEACARADIEMLILDRPNPVGGAVLEGPIASQTSSDVCWAAVPIRHGMTMGEIATWFRENDLRGQRFRLSINRLDTWRDDFLFQECALPWIPPSPNIPTPETALLYVGMCLFEGVNLNEGRGTEFPFARVGAPWLDAEAIATSLPAESLIGFRVTPGVYTPRSIPGKASSPKYQDAECQGLQIAVEDARAARPFTLATAILCAIARRHSDQLEWKPFFDTLAGGSDLRQRIASGQDAMAIVESYASALRQFDARRPKLYAYALG